MRVIPCGPINGYCLRGVSGLFVPVLLLEGHLNSCKRCFGSKHFNPLGEAAKVDLAECWEVLRESLRTIVGDSVCYVSRWLLSSSIQKAAIQGLDGSEKVIPVVRIGD